MPGALAVVLSGFPRRSETFALNELAALEARGLLGAVIATKPGDGQEPQPAARAFLPRVEYLAPGTAAEQGRELAGRLAGRGIAGVHGYFAHTPAEVASHAARRLGVRYGFSTHARDARKVRPAELASRARAAACVIACNPDVARTLDASGAATHLVPHGVDLERFQPTPLRPVAVPLRLLAVGRLVPKKGFDVLLEAAARVPWAVELDLVGDGPELGRLRGLTLALHLASRVRFLGSLTHAELPGAYARADVVVVPSVEDESGDRDGLPNVVLEAMASSRPIVASDMGAIGSAITHGVTGLLVQPGSVPQLVESLTLVASDPVLRAGLAERARERVEQRFTLTRCADRLERILAGAYV
jgi:glycosyltransferase involved in cell wall biosynthesis